VCFHAQPCAEKYLKALLEELGHPVPRTHNLDDLGGLLFPHHPTLRSLRRGLVMLTDFAVAPGYPGMHASRRQAAAALRWATRVRTACRGLLGLPVHRPPGRR
jgi:HEPN domain-containing protein